MLKHLILVFLLSIFSIVSNAKTQERIFSFGRLDYLDENLKTIIKADAKGTIEFSKEESKVFISIKIGNETIFEGKVYETKELPPPMADMKVIEYDFTMEYQGKEVGMILMEHYVLSHSNVVPKSYLLTILTQDGQGGKILFNQSFQNISRISNEPPTNIGTSFSVMKKKFPELHHIGTDELGEIYEDGHTENGISFRYYFKNDILIYESMMVASNDGFAREVFNSWVDEIFIKYPGMCSKSSYDTKHTLYSKFRLHIIFKTDKGNNIAFLMYENGGWEDGITCSEID